ncbi:MAG: hypothetical protein GTO22_01430, partial [Gemmatimonadales bacterium]|nr:hypothetical protein [Gemmatimonadales bacterium]
MSGTYCIARADAHPLSGPRVCRTVLLGFSVVYGFAVLAGPALGAIVNVDFAVVVGTQPLHWGTNEVPSITADSSVTSQRLGEIGTCICRCWIDTWAFDRGLHPGPGQWNFS